MLSVGSVVVLRVVDMYVAGSLSFEDAHLLFIYYLRTLHLHLRFFLIFFASGIIIVVVIDECVTGL